MTWRLFVLRGVRFPAPTVSDAMSRRKTTIRTGRVRSQKMLARRRSSLWLGPAHRTFRGPPAVARHLMTWRTTDAVARPLVTPLRCGIAIKALEVRAIRDVGSGPATHRRPGARACLQGDRFPTPSKRNAELKSGFRKSRQPGNRRKENHHRRRLLCSRSPRNAGSSGREKTA